MKALKRLAILIMISGLLFSMSSCIVLATEKRTHDGRHHHDNGKHYGWYKNKKKPNHSYQNDNEKPGKVNKRNEKPNSDENKHRK